MELGEYISKYRKEAGITIEELALRSGVPKGTINKIIAGTTKSPTLDTVQSLAAALDKTITDFIDHCPSTTPAFTHEETSIIKKYRVLDAYGKRAVSSVLDVEYDRMTNIVEEGPEKGITYINCYDLAVSAGLGEPWSSDDGYKTRLEIPSQQVPEKASYCARVNGDSMEPAYHDGDIVFVQYLDGGFVLAGEIGIFFLNGEGYMKRMGKGVLESLNPKYKPITIHDYDDLRCQGRVLGKI